MRIIRCCSSYKSTVVTTEYTIEYFTADIGVDEYIERFRDEARFIELCEKCPNFGCSWGCPPFDFDTDEFLRQYKYAHLMATKIIPDRNDIPVEMIMTDSSEAGANAEKVSGSSREIAENTDARRVAPIRGSA